MSLLKGRAKVFPESGTSFDVQEIFAAIQDAGFTVRELSVKVKGTVTAAGNVLQLQVPGLGQPFVLAGGAGVKALSDREDLRGKQVLITGHLEPGPEGDPPRLTVDEYSETGSPAG